MLNKWVGIGNLGADVEIRTFGNGGRVANLRLACTEKWKKDGQQHERTEWVTIAIFTEGLVGIAERFLKKGSKIYIEGKLQTRKWQDQSGNDRYSTEVVLHGFDAKLVMLDGPKGESQGHGNGAQGYQAPSQGGAPAGGVDLDGDSIPFAPEWRA
jgi:single-strand DNA-binding protein